MDNFLTALSQWFSVDEELAGLIVRAWAITGAALAMPLIDSLRKRAVKGPGPVLVAVGVYLLIWCMWIGLSLFIMTTPLHMALLLLLGVGGIALSFVGMRFVNRLFGIVKVK